VTEFEHEDLKRHWIERWLAQDTSDAVEFMQAVTRRDDVTDRLDGIEAPAVVIHGEEDVAIEMSQARALADGLAGNVEVVEVPGAGHSSTVERPDLVTPAIERFLARTWPA
jgi:pimeloyl-ACP methyl ester carboxylesterase